MKPTTLSFVCSDAHTTEEALSKASNIEKDFITEYNESNIPQFRSACLFGTIVLMCAMANDGIAFVSERHLHLRLGLRGLGMLITLSAAGYTYFTESFKQRMQLVGGGAAFLSVAMFNINLFIIPSWHLVDVNLICITIVSLFLRLRFVTTIWVNSFR